MFYHCHLLELNNSCSVCFVIKMLVLWINRHFKIKWATNIWQLGSTFWDGWYMAYAVVKVANKNIHTTQMRFYSPCALVITQPWPCPLLVLIWRYFKSTIQKPLIIGHFKVAQNYFSYTANSLAAASSLQPKLDFIDLTVLFPSRPVALLRLGNLHDLSHSSNSWS